MTLVLAPNFPNTVKLVNANNCGGEISLLNKKLLPDNHFMLWDALAWAFLIYILLFWLAGNFIDSSWLAVVFRTVLCVVYIPVYIGSFWLLDSRYGALGHWLMITLGLIGHVDYWGAIAFQLPAVAFMVWAQSTTKAIINLSLVTVLTIIAAWLANSPTVYLLLIAPLVLIGGLGEHFFFRKMRAENELLQAQAALATQATQLERERIARDLHDVMGHSLSAITIKSELATKLIDADPARAKQEMLDVEHTARTLLQDVRQAVVGYQADGLQHEYNMAKATLQSAGINVQASAQPITLADNVDNTLCLILREAVTNIVRHANATTVTLKGARQGDYYHISICDNGVGLGDAQPGNGMRNIDLRAKHIGASAQYERRDQGCCLQLKVKIND